MNERTRKKLKSSAITALVVSLLFPSAWYIVLGHSKRSPIVEKGYVESMPAKEREQWFLNNMETVGIFEHVKSTPKFILDNWRGYIQTSIGVFVLIFIFNSAFLLRSTRNEP